MNDMENLRTFADQLWKYIVPKIDSKFASNVSYFRAQVVSNLGNNKLEVQRPLENRTLTLPCVRAMSGAQAGQQVVALVMGSMSNAIVVGDGNLNVPGGGGGAGIANFQAQPDGSLVITLTNGVTFTATPIMDDVPTRGSNLAVKSGGIYTALNGKADNAFSNVQVGSTTISADNNADTLTLNAGGLVTLTGNATNDSVTIYVDPNHTHITTQVLDLVNADSYGPSGLVTFDADVAEVPLKNCIVDIEPAQAGSGDPSPSNIRPISGWTGAKVTHAGGKNLLNQRIPLAVRDSLVWTNDTALFSGTGTWRDCNYPHMGLHAGTAYTLSCHIKIITAPANSYKPAITIRNESMNRIIASASIASGATEADLQLSYTPNSDLRCYVSILITNDGGGSASVEFSKLQLEIGSAKTAYEAFVGTVYDVTFPAAAGTVYSGTLDVLKGTLTVSHKLITLTGQETNWTKYGADAVYVPASSGLLGDAEKSQPGTGNSITGSCSICPSAAAGYIYRGYVEKANPSGGVQFNNLQARWGLAAGFTVADWKARLQELSAAGTPVQILYKLAAPLSYQLTPEIIATLAGQNHIWADTGNITVEYGAFLSALDKAIEEHSDDDIRHITEAERTEWNKSLDYIALLTAKVEMLEREIEKLKGR